LARQAGAIIPVPEPLLPEPVVTAVEAEAEAHVHHGNARVLVEDPLEAQQEVDGIAASARAEDLHRDDPHVRRATQVCVGAVGGDDARHPGPVAVIVLGGAGAGVLLLGVGTAAGHAHLTVVAVALLVDDTVGEIRVQEIHAGVHDRDGGPAAGEARGAHRVELDEGHGLGELGAHRLDEAHAQDVGIRHERRQGPGVDAARQRRNAVEARSGVEARAREPRAGCVGPGRNRGAGIRRVDRDDGGAPRALESLDHVGIQDGSPYGPLEGESRGLGGTADTRP
jgi:hypothetical protein